MTGLQTILYQYAQEQYVPVLLHPNQKELRDNQKMAEEALEQLNALGEEAAGMVKRMEDGMLVCSSIEQEAGFLAGLAIGLELGRG